MAAALLSCATVSRTVVAPPQIPGATYVGSKSCSDCHEDITKGFDTATHARLQAHGPNATEVGCESCHGPGSLHSESGGVKHTIVNPQKSPETCFQCHLEMRGQFALPYHHPLAEGRVTCSDCHDAHKGPAIQGGGTALAGADETCLRCHSAQRGPHVFEHEAMREGCATCHNPHGSVNPKLLTARNAVLCLKCHFQQQAPGQLLIGGRDHSTFVSRGTCWTAGCHEAVHGSKVSSSLRF
jgi:predicted CXXCH cytochrome family protein